MAEPQDTGLFDAWITDRIYFQVVPPRTGSTGEFESWITDRIYYRDYVEAELVPPVPPAPPIVIIGSGKPIRRRERPEPEEPWKPEWKHPWEGDDEDAIFLFR